jgi:hypothetical protein
VYKMSGKFFFKKSKKINHKKTSRKRKVKKKA